MEGELVFELNDGAVLVIAHSYMSLSRMGIAVITRPLKEEFEAILLTLEKMSTEEE